jgi:hypothetical protein
MFRSNEDTIGILQDQLEQARRSLIHLMSVEAREILRSYRHCRSREASWDWADIATEKIIALAKPFPTGGLQSSDRAYCPLCGQSASVRSEEGFSIPERLRRHLIGWTRGHRQCSVFNAAEELAREYLKDKLWKAEEGEGAAALRRRMSETLYNVSPDEPLQLLEEGSFVLRHRNRNGEMAWVEARLGELGFEIIIEGNVKSYTLGSETFIVYADPREIGSISFGVVMKTSPLRQSEHEGNFFSFSDKLKNDIRRIFRSRLLRATNEPNDSYFLRPTT